MFGLLYSLTPLLGDVRVAKVAARGRSSKEPNMTTKPNTVTAETALPQLVRRDLVRSAGIRRLGRRVAARLAIADELVATEAEFDRRSEFMTRNDEETR